MNKNAVSDNQNTELSKTFITMDSSIRADQTNCHKETIGGEGEGRLISINI